MKDVLDRQEIVDDEVKKLISTSLSKYYFDKIGDELINLRKVMKYDPSGDEVEDLLYKINALLEAYNTNSGQCIDIANILPKEAVNHYQQICNN